jgi:hypothetical protein
MPWRRSALYLCGMKARSGASKNGLSSTPPRPFRRPPAASNMLSFRPNGIEIAGDIRLGRLPARN